MRLLELGVLEHEICSWKDCRRSFESQVYLLSREHETRKSSGCVVYLRLGVGSLFFVF